MSNDQTKKLKAEIHEWSDIAYEMWAVLCNSRPGEHCTDEEWQAAFSRLRDRFHAALPGAMDDRPHATDAPACSSGDQVQ